MLSTILTTNCGRSWCNATLKQNKLWTVMKPTYITYSVLSKFNPNFMIEFEIELLTDTMNVS